MLCILKSCLGKKQLYNNYLGFPQYKEYINPKWLGPVVMASQEKSEKKSVTRMS